VFAEQILNQEKSTKKTRRKRNDKITNPSNKEEKKNTRKKAKDEYEQQTFLQLQQMKSLLPEPIIYDPSDSRIQQRNLPLAADNNSNNAQDQQQNTITTTDAKEITDYYLTFHKNMINIYNSIYSLFIQIF
jgi:hypothetical protein